MSYKAQFYKLVDYIKANSDLKIKIYHKNALDKRYSGYYSNGLIQIAIGGKNKDWEFNLFVLAHEYCHFLLEEVYDHALNKKIDLANVKMYKKWSREPKFVECVKTVMKDEYMTEVAACKLLDRLGVKYSKRRYWERANWYNLHLKIYLALGIHVEVEKSTKLIKKRRLTIKQALTELTTAEIQLMCKEFTKGIFYVY